MAIDGEQIRISSPDEPWEQTIKPIQEGSIALKRANKIFIVYSAGASWTSAYKLGLLMNAGGDVLDSAS